MITHKKLLTRLTVVLWIELVLALSVLGGLIALNIYHEHAQIEANERDRLITQANVISKNLAFQFQGANQALLAIIQEIPEWKHQQQVATKRLTTMASTMPGIRGFDVFDADGTLIYTSFPEYLGMNFSYRDYYQTARRVSDPDRLYVSPPFTGMSGNYILNLTRIIPGKQGEFSGIVTAILDPEYFKPLLASVLYTQDSRSSLIHSKGVLFMSVPDNGLKPGTNLATPGSFFTRHIQSGKAVTVFSGQLYSTRQQRMVAQTTLAPGDLKLHSTLMVAVSRDLERIFRYWYENAMIQIICFSIFALFTFTMLFVFQRRESKHARMAAEHSHALFQSEKLFRSTYDSAAIGMALLGLDGRFMQANRALCHMLGQDEAALCQKTIQQITHPDDHQLDHLLLDSLLTSQRDNYQVEKRFFHSQGHTLWVLLTYSSIKDEAGQLQHFVVQIQDITEYKALQEKLQKQANQDFLTGLPNRRHFIQEANIALARLKRRGGAIALLMIDIDHFKKINDNYGHQAGDVVLQAFARQCQTQLRDIDLISRYGGEEFAILLPDTQKEQAIEIAERLRTTAANTEMHLGNHRALHLTISIGLAATSDTSTSLEKLLVKADAALYHAKQSGRNAVSVAQADAP